MNTPATFPITLTPEQGERLEDLAARRGTTPNLIIIEAIDALLEDLEDEEWAKEVIAEWEASDKVTRPLSELRSELGL